MKTWNYGRKPGRLSGFISAAIVIAVLAVVSQASAQYRPTGNDGITASPRLRLRLDEAKGTLTAPKATASVMPCPKCKDEWVAHVNTEPKGIGARTLMGHRAKLVVEHLCTGCGADWSVVGTGKGKHAVAIHTCSNCGSANLACCAAKDSGMVATRGMARTFQEAPLK